MVNFTYFICLISSNLYLQISAEDKIATASKHNDIQTRNEQQCLINLEELNGTNPNNDQAVSIDIDASQLSSNNPFKADDTFTQLANRTQTDKTTKNTKLYVIPPSNHHTISTLDDSGEFAVPTSANSEDINKSFKFPLTGEFTKMVNCLDNPPLPTPVEVISINNKDFSHSDTDGINENQNISGDHSLNPFLFDDSLTDSPNKKDDVLLQFSNGQASNSNTKSFGNLGGIKEEEKEVGYPLLPAKSEPQMLKQLIFKQQKPR